MGILNFKTKLKYKPLKSTTAIRLVVIHPGSGDNPMECHLIHTEVGETAYEALSYEWKESSQNGPMIIVNDKRIIIRENLYHALKQIRHPETDRYIWIDALCINQRKVKERNAQVQIMGDIYSGASKVIVWLGNAEDKSDDAIKMLQDISAQVVLKRTEQISDEEYENRLGHLSNNYSHKDWKALVALCQRPYWSRIWVLQEVHLAKTYEVRCGSKFIGGAEFQSSIAPFAAGVIKTDISSDYCRIISTSAVAAHRLAKDISSQSNTLRRWIIVTSSGGFISKKPHDMIYALLGVSRDWQNGEVALIPDYKKPLLDLFLDVVPIVKSKPPGINAKKALRELAKLFKCTTDARVKEILSQLERTH
ncbi:hypothetical protein EYC80_006546 [Monilinia laxa]|uniref:Heterokaryon incompatibility domain-containing protein n=1 Tax=Monilinia laxa TaxID=61186 RepID=A0A5N6JUU3_MONLA|nr:hypothetical protein EYC80_006546 [Monilinia laxa]